MKLRYISILELLIRNEHASKEGTWGVANALGKACKPT